MVKKADQCLPGEYGLGGREIIKAYNKTFGSDVYIHYQGS